MAGRNLLGAPQGQPSSQRPAPGRDLLAAFSPEDVRAAEERARQQAEQRRAEQRRQRQEQERRVQEDARQQSTARANRAAAPPAARSSSYFDVDPATSLNPRETNQDRLDVVARAGQETRSAERQQRFADRQQERDDNRVTTRVQGSASAAQIENWRAEIEALEAGIAADQKRIESGELSGRAAGAASSSIEYRRREQTALANKISTGRDLDYSLGDAARETVNAPFRGAISTLYSGIAGLSDAVGADDFADSARMRRDDLRETYRAPDASEQTVFGETASTIGEGIGSTGPFLLGGLGVPGRVAAGGLASGAGIDNQDERIRAVREQGIDVSEGQEALAQTLGSVVGLSELAPLNALLGRVPKGYGQQVISRVSERIASRATGRIAGAALEEGVQEAAAGVAQDLIELGVYNENVEVGQSALSDFALGAAVGGIVRGGGEAVRAGVDATGRIARRNPNDNRVAAPGRIVSAIERVARPTAEDEASPLDTSNIVEGRIAIERATAESQINRELEAVSLPNVGERVVINDPAEGVSSGVMRDRFSGPDGSGVVIELDNGTTIREFDDTFAELGITVMPAGDSDAALASAADLAIREAAQAVQQTAQTVPSPETSQEPPSPAPAEAPPSKTSAPQLVDDGGAIITSLFGDRARITQTRRDPNSALGKANPRSYHTRTNAAVDMAAIPGMTFEETKAQIEAAGYTLIEAIDEYKNPSPHATGGHWHFVIAQGGGGAQSAAGAAAVTGGTAPGTGRARTDTTGTIPDAPSAEAAAFSAPIRSERESREAVQPDLLGGPDRTESEVAARETLDAVLEQGRREVEEDGGALDLPAIVQGLRQARGNLVSDGNRVPRASVNDYIGVTDGTPQAFIDAVDANPAFIEALAERALSPQDAAPVADQPAPERISTEQVGGNAGAQPDAPAKADTTPAPTVTFEELASGKGITVIGMSDAQIEMLKSTVPKAKPGPPRKRDGAITYSKKHEAAIRDAIASDAPSNSAPDIKGEDIGEGWSRFSDTSGTLNIPRAEMPQVKAEDRGAMVNFLNARGINHAEETIAATELKPTQVEFSPEKVQKAKEYKGGNRAILVSSDGHVVDGHHQWLASRDKGEDIRIIRLDAPIRDLLPTVSEMPSAQTDGDASSPTNADVLKAAQDSGRLEIVDTRSGSESSNRKAIDEGFEQNRARLGDFKKGDRVEWDHTDFYRDGRSRTFQGTVLNVQSKEQGTIQVEQDGGGTVTAGARILRKATDQEAANTAPQTTETRVSQPKTRTDQAPNRLVTEDRAAELRKRLKEKLNPNRLNAGIDPEILTIGAELAVYHIEKGARKFIAMSKAIAADLETSPQSMKRYLRSWYNGARDLMEDSDVSVDGMDNADTVRALLGSVDEWGADTPQATNQATPQSFADLLLNGQSFDTITQARKALAEIEGNGPAKPGTPDAKRADEAIEMAIVQAARTMVADGRKQGRSALEIYRSLVDLYQRQPNLSVRTSTSVKEQAYSTPIPLAFLASERAGIDETTVIYEPSAGNAALLIAARDSNVTANELNPDRAAALRTILPGATVTESDATNNNDQPTNQDVMIANPPFGAVKDADGDTIRYDLGGGYMTGEVDHAIAMRALESIKGTGRAVLIVGGIAKTVTDQQKRADAYNGKSKREFYYRLYSEYNVTDHFTVPGELYAKQGAGWPVDVIVIEGRGKSKTPLPSINPPRIVPDWTALETELVNANDQVSRQAQSAGGRLADTGAGELSQSADGRVGESGNRSGITDVAPEQDEFSRVRDGSNQREPNGGRPDARESGGRRPAAESSRPRELGRTRERTEVDAGRLAQDGEVAPAQVPYVPASGARSLDTLVPFNMQTASTDALLALEAENGSVDSYVSEKLNYDRDKVADYFSAEQVDALALAISNMEAGAGFIIGDQTGIGKGRVVAGVIRYAIINGRKPIFVTEKPNLYGDMYRDMNDVGLPEMLGRDVEILMTNAAQKVPLDSEGKAVLKTPSAKQHNAALERAARGEVEFDVLFTTYSQMQTHRGNTTPRQRVIEAMAPGAILVFDESHNAGGGGPVNARGKKGAEGAGPLNRADFARKIAGQAHGVFFSSATYAKRPEVMDLYASTDMKYAVADIKTLGEAIAKGGIPMQQIVASMLAESGQYLRRERSFDGVVYDTPRVEVGRDLYSAAVSSISAIRDFEDTYVTQAIKDMDKEIRSEAASIATDGAIGQAGAHSTNFTSVMHNLIGQMLLSLKADAAASRAIEAIQAGQKPVITVANTMGAFLEEHAQENGIGNGQDMPLDFRAMLDRYLSRTRQYVIKKPFSKEKGEKKYISDAELGAEGLAAYKRVERQIEALDISNLPISPIDYIRQKLIDAGYSVGEITGRKFGMDYSAPVPRLRLRSSKETSITGKRKAIDGFNDGTIDSMILNQSGATGLSLHASEKFKDQRPRSMIIAQAELNVDTHMQMLGRIHRTGQVVLPSYQQLVASVPAEMRPAAVLAKKMASLNANTTGARDSAMTSDDVPDFMNEFGDEIAARLMEEDTPLHIQLGKPLKSGDKNSEGLDREDAARRVTGRITLLPLEKQEEFYERFIDEYTVYLEQKEAAGEATLEAKTLPLDARVISKATLVGATKKGSPFGAPVFIETLDVKRLGKPFTPDEIFQKIADAIGADQPDQSNAQALSSIAERGSIWVNETIFAPSVEEFDGYASTALGDISDSARAGLKERLDANRSAFTNLTETLYPGAGIEVYGDDGGVIGGVVTGLIKRGKAQNPIALSTWHATIAVADSARSLTFPLSQLRTDSMPEGPRLVRPATKIEGLDLLQAFTELQVESRETRVMMTGNILAAYEQTNNKGLIVNFVGQDGTVRPGIIMRRAYDHDAATARQPIVFRTGQQVAEWIRSGETAFGEGVNVRLEGGEVVVTVPQSKSAGGKFYLNPEVQKAVNGDFVSSSGSMRVRSAENRLSSITDALMKVGANFAAKDNKEKARQIIAQDSAAAKDSIPERQIPFSERDREADGPAIQREFDADGLKERLRSYGIREKVAVQVVETLGGAAGRYTPRQQALIQVATDTAQDQTFTLDHEAIHAMRDLGLFKKDEWSILSARARREDGLMRSIKQRYPKLDAEAQVEEAIADMFARHQRGDYTARGTVERLLKMVGNVMESLRNAFAGRGLRTAGAIMDATSDGGSLAMDGNSVIMDGATGIERFSIPERTEAIILAGKEPTFKGKMETAFNAFRRASQDRYLPLLRVQRDIELREGSLPADLNAYQGEELLAGRIGSRLEELFDENVRPLFDAMADEKVTTEELETYLYARHAPERNAEMQRINPDLGDGEGSGMTDREARAIMSRIEREGKTDAMKRLAKRVDKMRDEAIDRRVDTGLMSEDQASEWRSTYNHYIPLRGFAEVDGNPDDAARINKSGGGINVRGAESKAAYGRRSEADSPLTYTILQAEEAIVRGETNRVAQRFVELAKANPDDTFWKVNKAQYKRRKNPDTGIVEDYLVHNLTAEDKDWTVVAKFDGKERRVTMNRANPEARALADSMRNLTQHQLDFVTKYVGAVNRFLSRVNTSYNPEFIVSNALRDIQTAGVNLTAEDQKGLVTGTLKDYRKALVASTKGAWGNMEGEWGQTYRDFIQDGGRVYFNQVEDVGLIKKRLTRTSEQVRAARGEKNARLQAKRMFRAAVDAIENTNLGVENAIRLAAYKNAREGGMSRDNAASLAKNLTVNFNRRGTFGPIMNSLYLFYNASMQGSVRLLQAMRSRRVQKLMAGVVAGSAMLELMNAMVSGDDDDGESYYDKIPDYEKRRNLIIMLPGGSDYVKIPLPYGYNVFANIGQAGAEVARRGGDRWQESAGGVLTSIMESFNPVGFDFDGRSGWEAFVSLAAPSAIDPIVDLSQNRDFTGRPIMPEENQYAPDGPEHQRYFNGTAPYWRSLAGFLNTATGGDDVVEGAVSVSPAAMEHLAGTLVGAAGAFTNRVLSVPGKIADPEFDFDVSDVPFARKAVGTAPRWYDKSAYYERIGTVEAAVRDTKDYLEREQFDSAAQYAEANKRVLSLEPAMKAAQKELRAIRKASRANEGLFELGKIDEPTYEAERSVIRDAEDIVITRFNTTWNETVQNRRALDAER